MKKVIFSSLVALMLLSGATHAKAFYVDLVPNSSLIVPGVGSSIAFDVVFNPEGTVTLDTYTFNLSYDTSEMTWNSSGTTTSPPSPLIALFGPPAENTSGEISNFNGATFSGNATISSITTLATVAFNVASGVDFPVGDGSQDVSFDTSVNPALGFTVDGQGYTMAQSVKSSGTITDIAVAPEPVSSTLFLIGGATLGYRQFRKKKATA